MPVVFGVIKAAIWSGISWFVRGPVVMFFLYWALFYIASEGIAYLMTKIKLDGSDIQTLLSQMSPGFWYFAQLFMLPVGLTTIITAAVLRFAIRRIPIIG